MPRTPPPSSNPLTITSSLLLLLQTLNTLILRLDNTSPSISYPLTALTALKETLQTFHQKVVLEKAYDTTRGELISLETISAVVSKVVLVVREIVKEENGEKMGKIVEEMGNWRGNLGAVLGVLGW